MSLRSSDDWIRFLRYTLRGYDETLLRTVARKLIRPRSEWPVEELIERILAALQNAVLLDRRMRDLPREAANVLALMARSRQGRWPVGGLVELAAAVGHADGLAAVVTLLDAGLLLPELFLPERLPSAESDETASPVRNGIKGFETWLALSTGRTTTVIAPPLVMARALQEETGLPPCPGAVEPTGNPTVQEADGLEWPLRLAVIWQQVRGGALRRTQQGEFFKRDYDRLQSDSLVSGPPSDGLGPVPGPGFFVVALAAATGLLQEDDAELSAGDFSPAWKTGLVDVLAEVWAGLPWLRGWNAAAGSVAPAASNPFPSTYLLAVLLLSQLPEGAWAEPREIETWVREKHPYWQAERSAESGVIAFLLGIAFPLRLLQARKQDAGWVVRLSPLGRWLLGGGERSPTPTFPQTLLVQPNLEILAYRQGLNPELIVRLTHLATWKGLGPACTLQLEPHSVYHALEAGETLGSIVQLLERHGMKTLPNAVLDSLRTWADKRERLSIYASAALFEFSSAAELTEALARGLPAVRLTDRLAVVANEADIDYRHFRLTGTRDFLLPPEKCVDVDPDGVTLSVDLARSDLLLETELQRFAELAPRPSPQGRRLYRVTPASIGAARENGLTESGLETWFQQRTGFPASAAAHLMFAGPEVPAPSLRRELVLQVSSVEIADGLQQWPGTRSLIVSRLGPTALVVAEEHVPVLTERLRELGVSLSLDAV